MDLTTIKFNHETNNFLDSFGMQYIEFKKICNKVRELLALNPMLSQTLEKIINDFAEKPEKQVVALIMFGYRMAEVEGKKGNGMEEITDTAQVLH